MLARLERRILRLRRMFMFLALQTSGSRMEALDRLERAVEEAERAQG